MPAIGGPAQEQRQTGRRRKREITGLGCPARQRGQPNFDLLKVSTDDGLVGWSEYDDSFGGKGVTSALDQLAPVIMGRDPRAYEAVLALLKALRRQASGGMVQQAIGAVENALLDIKAKALGIPVYQLFGGPVRERIRLYWSHCGTYRLAAPSRRRSRRCAPSLVQQLCRVNPAPQTALPGVRERAEKAARRQRLRGCV